MTALTGAEISARYRARHPERAREFVRVSKARARARDLDGARAQDRAYYAEHREHVRAKQAAFRAARASALAALKDRPCADCGGRFHSAAMEFDHIPGRGEKVFNVSRIVHKKPWAAVLAEVAKCEVVCANCHRVRTFTRATR